MKRAWMILAFLPCPAFAGAWLQGDDDLLISTQAIYYDTDSFYDNAGEEQSQETFTKKELNLFVEYGYSERLTLGTNLFLNHVEQGSDDNIGIADPEIFARMALFKTDHSVFSIQPLVKLASSYQNESEPRGGTDSYDGELSALYGTNMPLISPRDYLDLRAGYRARSNGLNAQYKLDAAYGMYLGEKLSIVPALRSVIAARKEDAAFSNSGALDYDLHKAELNLYYSINEVQQISLGYFNHFAGEQTGAGQGFTLGLVQRF